MASPSIQEFEFKTAEGWLGALAPTAELWSAADSWLFRGHADASWKLLPSALRPGANLRYHPGHLHGRGPVPCYEVQIKSEFALLSEFAVTADRQGIAIDGSALQLLMIPTISQLMEQEFPFFRPLPPVADARSMLTRPDLTWRNWIPNKLLQVASLAQHSGVPTRLLDWSYHSRTAGFIAAQDAARSIAAEQHRVLHEGQPDPAEKDSARAGNIEVIAFPTWWLSVHGVKHRWGVRLVHPPRSGNANMHAQAGVFSLDRRPPNENENYQPRPLDLLCAELASQSDDFQDMPLMVKIRLPRSEAPRALRLLAQEGVTSATVYPGLAGVVKALEEKRWWDPD